jgi:hypothetical protein
LFIKLQLIFGERRPGLVNQSFLDCALYYPFAAARAGALDRGGA